MSERCGYAVTGDEGEQEPCDRPATGWRWYQGVGDHEDMLDVACEWHRNEGGDRMAAHDALAEAVRELRDEWRGWAAIRSTTRIDAFRDAADALDRILTTTPEGDHQ